MRGKKIYKAAFSQIDITPEYPTSLVGRYRPDSSQGILNRLFAQVLLFQEGSESFCLVAIDSLGLTIQLAIVLRSKIAVILDTEISHVMLNFSHTHSAPEPTLYAINGERYFNYLCEQIITCAETAKNNFIVCKIGWSLTTASIGENRRDGGTALDNRLGALMIANADNYEPIVLVTRITAHANILPGENRSVSSDFIGIAREELQQFYGYPIMILQGAAGNIKAAGTNNIGEGNDDVFYRVAHSLVDSVKKLHFNLQEVTDIQMFSRDITCISDIPTNEEALKISYDYQTLETQNWLKACEAFREKGVKTQQSQVEVNFLKLNEGCICGVADEIFCELALDAQKRTGNPLFFLNGYTNGCSGYLPSRAEWDKGGWEVFFSYFYYHTYSGRVMPYRVETADLIVDFVVNEWAKMTVNP